MSAQFFMTLLMTIWPWPEGKSISSYYNDYNGVRSTMRYQIPCSPSFHVTFARNIFLSTNRRNRIYAMNNSDPNVPPKKVVAMAWTPSLEHIRRRGGSIVILNRGAHYVPDAALLFQLSTTFTYLQQYHNDSLIIYRDTPRGHPNYKKYQRSAPLKRELLPSDYTPVQWNEYTYSQFEHQNDLVRHLIASKYPEIIFMGVARATNLRRDSHLDALHYCLPGPVDHWVQSLFDVLAIADDEYPRLAPVPRAKSATSALKKTTRAVGL